MKRSFWKNVYLQYTIAFLLLLPIIFMPFLLEGKSFVWDNDGFRQHFPVLQYYGSLLRNALSGNGFPMVDFKLGLGFDTITTVHYYGLGDPIAILTLLFTSANAVFLYGILILLRFYLAGISFVTFCRYWKQDGLGVILGGLLYIFCGYSLFAGVRHPYFLNSMIYLPLIIMGLEQVLRRKKPYLLIIMAFISTASNFYFFYILTMIAVGYVIFRYLYLYRKSYEKVIWGFFETGFRTGGCWLLGAAMAGVIFVPVVYAFMNNGRLDSVPQMMYGYFHYGKLYYITLIQGIFAPGITPGFWVELSFPAITAVSFAIAMCNKKYRQFAITLLVTFSALLIPITGYIMNGFSYVTNRWCFLINLLVAFTFVITYEKFFKLNRYEKILLAVITAGYGIFAFAYPSEDIVKTEFFILLITVVVLLILQMNWFQNRKYLQDISLVIMVFLLLGIQGYNYYSPDHFGYVDEFLSKKEIDTVAKKGVTSVIPEIKDSSFYRVETNNQIAQNRALISDFNDVSAYYSLVDGNITRYLKDAELLELRTANSFGNLDHRTALDALASVKYVVTSDQAAPYGYKLLKKVNRDAQSFYVYENTLVLPLGYTYENYMTEEDYNKLSVLEKQDAMLSAVVMENDTEAAQQMKEYKGEGIEKLDYKITADGNIKLGKNSIKVKEPDGTVTLEFNAKPGTETYVRFKNLRFELNEEQDSMFTFYLNGENREQRLLNVRNSYNSFYFGKENHLVNIGYNASGENKVTISFSKKASYSFDSLEVYSVSMNGYQAKLQALQNTSLTNIKQSNNRITGDIKLDKKGVMALSIPFNKGWSAYVDGQKTELLRANVMYMALPLEAGNHHIVLKYETPFLLVGAGVSLVAFLIFIGIIVYNQKIDRWLKKDI